LQPDWFEVTEPGVGTNRYSYSFNDPVNLRDPLGNLATGAGFEILQAIVSNPQGALVTATTFATRLGGATLAALAVALVPANVGTKDTVGSIITETQLAEGWSRDGNGNLRDGDGVLVKDANGTVVRQSTFSERVKKDGGAVSGQKSASRRRDRE